MNSHINAKGELLIKFGSRRDSGGGGEPKNSLPWEGSLKALEKRNSTSTLGGKIKVTDILRRKKKNIQSGRAGVVGNDNSEWEGCPPRFLSSKKML